MSGLFAAVLACGALLLPSALMAGNGTDTSTTTTTTTTPSTTALSFSVPNPLGTSTTTLDKVLSNVLDAIVLLLTPVITIMLLYCGFLFISAQGNVEKLGDAKRALMYTLIGAAVILGAKGLSLVLSNTITCLATTGSC